MQIVSQNVRLRSITENAVDVIETAARISHQSEGSIGVPFLLKLWDWGHHSVFEHAYASFIILTDRGISHELVRHRLASYTQESTRYCAYTSTIKVIRPDPFVAGDFSLWSQCIQNCEDTYWALLKNGVLPQWARSVLPTCLATQICMTANLREWVHIIKMRTHKAAHPQIRELMNLIKNELSFHVGDWFERICEDKKTV